MAIEVEVRGRYLHADGAPATGRVKFIPRSFVVSTVDDTVCPPVPVVVDLDAEGRFTVDLRATDDPDAEPTGWTYAVRLYINGWTGERGGFDMAVPASAAGTGFDIADVTPVAAATGDVSAFVTSDQLVDAIAGVEAGLGSAAAEDVSAFDPAGAAAEAQAAAISAAASDAATKYDALPDSAMRRWFAALGNRHTAPAKVLVFGDSNSEGTGAGTFQKRWMQVLQDALRSRYPVPGVTGAEFPYITASPRQTPALTGAPVSNVGATSASFGLGLRALTVEAGDSVTFTFTGDRCIFYATKGPSVGRYSIVLDGGAATVVDGFNSGTLITGQQIWDSGAISSGAHTVVVTRADTTTANPGNVFPEGLLTFNGDFAAGVRVIDGARHGTQVSTFSDSTAWQTALTNLGPFGLAIMPWGANDAVAGVTAATFKTKLLDLIADMRGAGFAGSVLLVGMPKRSEITDVLWVEYLTAMREVAADDADVAFLDLRSRIPDAGSAEAVALDLYVDTVHYKPGAQGWIADEILHAISPR
jgi:hypothetical protein